MDKARARVYWRALQAVDAGCFLEKSVHEFVTELGSSRNTDPDNLIAQKIILNASGVVVGQPLELNDTFGFAMADAIRQLANAAGVTEDGSFEPDGSTEPNHPAD